MDVIVAKSSFCCGSHAALSFFFFLNDRPTPEIYPLPLHDALPFLCVVPSRSGRSPVVHAASAAHISPAPSPRSLPMRRSVVVLTLLSVPAIVVGQGFRLTVESRSEEHTSELQSQSNLVCRLLLEKK